MIKAWYRSLQERLTAIRKRRTAEEQAQQRLGGYVAQLTAEARKQAVIE